LYQFFLNIIDSRYNEGGSYIGGCEEE